VVAPRSRALHLAIPGMVAHKRDLRCTRQGIVAVAVVICQTVDDTRIQS
jgi:hypothetical protein